MDIGQQAALPTVYKTVQEDCIQLMSVTVSLLGSFATIPRVVDLKRADMRKVTRKLVPDEIDFFIRLMFGSPI